MSKCPCDLVWMQTSSGRPYRFEIMGFCPLRLCGCLCCRLKSRYWISAKADWKTSGFLFVCLLLAKNPAFQQTKKMLKFKFRITCGALWRLVFKCLLLLLSRWISLFEKLQLYFSGIWISLMENLKLPRKSWTISS